MKIHFTFGQLAKKGLLEQQFENFIKLILTEKQLKVSICEEFIPWVNNYKEGTKHLDVTKGKLNEGSFVLDFRNQTKSPTISYLPEEVPMICFINIPFKKLRTSNHSSEYGKLGIVFSDKFYKKHELSQVHYYDEKSLKSDKLINSYISKHKSLSEIERIEIVKKIVTYRKPKLLTNNFSQSTIARIKGNNPGNTTLEFYTYDRYPIGYDFTQEREYRMTFEKSNEFLKFKEMDIDLFIVPDEDSLRKLKTFLEEHWKHQPKILIYPI